MMEYIDIATFSSILLRASQGCRGFFLRRSYRRTLFILHALFPQIVVELVANFVDFPASPRFSSFEVDVACYSGSI